MLSNELEAEAVQGTDMRRLEKRELLLPTGISRVQFRLTFQPRTNALSDFSGGSLRKRDDQDFIKRSRWVFIHEATQASFDQGGSFTRARARHDHHIAAGGGG